MIAKLRRWSENPVFLKEMRIGFREKKVFFALSAWVLIVALVAAIFSAAALSENRSISQLPETGKYLFETLFWLQLVLLAMLSPALTTSAISGERERQSFEMLMTTHLSPAELIFGKFGFGASFLILALCSTIPLEAIVFFLGGVSLATFLGAKLILLVFGLLCSLLGLMLSARETRSAYATGQTYLSLLILSGFVGPLIGILRYGGDAPWQALAIIVLVAIYLLLFFFWKSANHLEERAAHLKTILKIGLGFYILIVLVALSTEKFWGSINNSIWVLWAPAHYLLMGIFLNPSLPERQRERRLYANSPWSNPLTWMVVLGTGTLLPVVYSSDANSTEIAFYTLLAGLGSGLLARGLALNRPGQFPVILGGIWLTLNIIPPFFALGGLVEADKPFHPSFLSPLMFLTAGLDNSWQKTALLPLVFYAVLLVIGLVLCMRRREPKPPQGAA